MIFDDLIKENGGELVECFDGMVRIKSWHQTCDTCQAQVVDRRVDIKLGADCWRKCSACKMIYNPETQKYDLKNVISLRELTNKKN